MSPPIAFSNFAFCCAVALAAGCGREELPQAASSAPAVKLHDDPKEPIEEEYEEVEFYDAYEHLDPEKDVSEDDPGAKLLGTEMIYTPCDDAEADTVLVLKMTIPNVIQENQTRHYFRRHRIIRGWLNDVASYTSIGGGFVRRARIPGQGCFSTYVYHDVTTKSANEVAIDLRISWHGLEENGQFDVELPITIGEDGHKELDGGIDFRWTFEEPDARRK